MKMYKKKLIKVSCLLPRKKSLCISINICCVFRKVSLDSPEDLKVYPPPPVATGPGLDRPIHGPGHAPHQVQTVS